MVRPRESEFRGILIVSSQLIGNLYDEEYKEEVGKEFDLARCNGSSFHLSEEQCRGGTCIQGAANSG